MFFVALIAFLTSFVDTHQYEFLGEVFAPCGLFAELICTTFRAKCILVGRPVRKALDGEPQIVSDLIEVALIQVASQFFSDVLI